MNPIVKAVLEAAEPIVIAELTSLSSQIKDKNLQTFVQSIVPGLDKYLQAVVASL